MKKTSKKWKEFELGEVLNYEQPNDYIIKNPIVERKTEVPVLTPGKSFIKGYTSEKEGIYKKIQCTH